MIRYISKFQYNKSPLHYTPSQQPITCPHKPHYLLEVQSCWRLFSTVPTWRMGNLQSLPEWNLKQRKTVNIFFFFVHWVSLYTLRLRQNGNQNGRHFPDYIFKCIFWNENEWISIETSLKFVLKDPINNIPALFQVMAWRRPGAKPLSRVGFFPSKTCFSRPKWDKLG